MRFHHSTLGAIVAASLAAMTTGCGGAQNDGGAGAAFMNGADEAEYQAGLSAQQANNAAEAERRFKRALAANPNFLSARISLGNLQLAQGRNEDALATFEAAIATRATSVDGLVGAAEACMRMNQCDQAAAFAKLAIDSSKGASSAAQFSLAYTILGRCNDPTKVAQTKELLQRAINADSSNTEARIAIAEIHLANGSAADVVTALARAEEYERKPAYLLRIGRLMTTVHQPRRAVNVLTRAQQVDQANDDIAVALAEAQLAVGDGNLALQTLTDVVSRSPGRLDAQVLMGRAELAADRAEPARRRAVAVLESSPEDAGALHLMALLALSHDDLVTAEQSLRRALATQPKFVPALTELAEILAKRTAWSELVDLIGEDEQRAWAPNRWGDLLLQGYRAGGRLDLALPILSRLANERGSDPDAHAEVVELALKNPRVLDGSTVVRHAQAAFDRSGGSLVRYRLVLIDALAANNRVFDALNIAKAGLKAMPGNRELIQREQAMKALLNAKEL